MNTNIRLGKYSSKLPEAIVFRHLRTKSGLTCRELGKFLEVKNHSLIYHYESGKQRIPEDKLEKLRKIFKPPNGGAFRLPRGQKALTHEL